MNRKTLVIGLDGVPRHLLEDLMARGAMEGLQGLVREGYDIRTMKASLPDVSSVSWTSFMTGTNPARHGIFGFTDLLPASYDLYFPNSRDMRARPFWEDLQQGKKIERSVVLNLPSTYPAFPVKGLLVSGFVAIDFNKAVYPPSYIPLLRRLGYVIDVDLEKAREDREGFYGDLLTSLAVRQEAAMTLLRDEPWDLFILCITETDRLHHFFFTEKDSPRFDDFYRRVDRFVTAVIASARERFGDDIQLILLSDHGFTALQTEVNVNAYLQEMGVLKIDPGREYYDRIDRGTVAFAMDPARIYIHGKGRYPRGHIEAEDMGKAKEDMKALLFGLRDRAGNPVIRQIFDRDEIYEGPFLDRAPDLVCIPFKGFDLKGNLRKRDVFTTEVLTGMHTWDDAVLMFRGETAPREECTIEDPAKLIRDFHS